MKRRDPSRDIALAALGEVWSPAAIEGALADLFANCVRHGPASQNRGDHPRFREHLLGRIAWVEQTHPPRAARLRGLHSQIEWP